MILRLISKLNMTKEIKDEKQDKEPEIEKK